MADVDVVAGVLESDCGAPRVELGPRLPPRRVDVWSGAAAGAGGGAAVAVGRQERLLLALHRVRRREAARHRTELLAGHTASIRADLESVFKAGDVHSEIISASLKKILEAMVEVCNSPAEFDIAQG